jgi:hypothetical protein
MQEHQRPASPRAAVGETADLAQFYDVGHCPTVPASLRIVDARSLAHSQALGRLAFGAGLALLPAAFAGGWVGGLADRHEGQTLAIGLGARDAAIALGTLAALRSGRGARAWLRAGVLADAADLAGTLRARDGLPPLAAPVVATIAGGSMLLGAWLQYAID